MDELKNIGKAVGDPAAEPTNRNTVRTDAIYEGRTSDRKILEKHTGVVKFENKRIVIYNHGKKYEINLNGFDSVPIIWNPNGNNKYKGHTSYDRTGKPHGPFYKGDTVYYLYFNNGEVSDSFSNPIK